VARRVSRKELKQDEFGEAVLGAGHWVERNWNDLLKWAAAVVVGVGLAVGWGVYAQHRRQAADKLLAAAVRSYERASAAGEAGHADLERAVADLEQVVRRGKGASAQLARLYRGSALFHLGRLEDAATELRSVLEREEAAATLKASAAAMLVRVELAAGREDEATALLAAAVERPNETLPADQALLALGRIRSAGGQPEEAREAWQRVVDEFPASAAAAEARRLLEPDPAAQSRRPGSLPASSSAATR